MGTKNNPGDFDCYANALPDEPMFVLLARDEKAPRAVMQWARSRLVAHGGVPDEKYREAVACARAMEVWRNKDKAALARVDSGTDA